MHFVLLQKEENGKVMSTLPSAQNQFLQSGLGPGQEYEVSINIIKNNTRGPQTSKKVTTSECQSCRLDLTDEIIDVSKHPLATNIHFSWHFIFLLCLAAVTLEGCEKLWLHWSTKKGKKYISLNKWNSIMKSNNRKSQLARHSFFSQILPKEWLLKHIECQPSMTM